MSGLKQGWISFTDFCSKYELDKGGNSARKLKKLDDDFKHDTSSYSEKSYWIVNEEECKKLFEV